jgi:hypothetical protein
MARTMAWSSVRESIPLTKVAVAVLRLSVVGELPVLQPAQASVRPDPQASVVAGRQAPDVAVLTKLRRVLHVEDREALSIESDEAGLRAQPQVAVRRLANSPDGAERQPVTYVPLVKDVVSNRFRGVESLDSRSAGENDQQT